MVTPDSGKNATVNTVIEIGSNDVPLSLSRGVRLVIPGMETKEAAYYREATFTKITRVLSADTQAIADAEIPVDGDAKIVVGDDLVIWSKHFAKFIAYTQTEKPDTGTSDTSDDNGTTSDSTSSASTSITPAQTPTTNPVTKPETTQTTEKSIDLNDITSHWAKEAINKLVSIGAISGYPDKSFKPDDKMTRSEFLKVLIVALKIEVKSGKTFEDTQNHWAKDYISTGVANGFISGYSDTSFGPDDLITREQMALIIMKASRFKVSNEEANFTDKPQISTWAKDAVNAPKSNGIIGGYEDGSFRPQDNATRAEAVTVIYRLLNMK